MWLYRAEIPYDECVQLGADSLAFKWIPEDVASFAEVRGASCLRLPCNTEGCAEPGCMCIEEVCIKPSEDEFGPMELLNPNPGLQSEWTLQQQRRTSSME